MYIIVFIYACPCLTDGLIDGLSSSFLPGHFLLAVGSRTPGTNWIEPERDMRLYLKAQPGATSCCKMLQKYRPNPPPTRNGTLQHTR